MKKNIIYGICFLFAITVGCKKKDKDEAEPDNTMTQFASGVLDFSSEYNASPGDWSAAKAKGSPDVYPSYGDIVRAWTGSTADGNREYLVLSYTTPQTVNKIEVYETYKPGAIDTVYIRNATSGEWNQVYSGTAAAAGNSARIFTVNITETTYKVDAVRVALNNPVVIGYNEIDAISISGTK